MNPGTPSRYPARVGGQSMCGLFAWREAHHSNIPFESAEPDQPVAPATQTRIFDIDTSSCPEIDGARFTHSTPLNRHYAGYALFPAAGVDFAYAIILSASDTVCSTMY